ncbi:MAG TPA: tyrosine-type recombinase/integrase [Bacteroidia bacterium]|jgi:integrase|nr:tyrosine-type recombinase/integrase [Bacteroidia bacterium]
MNINSAARPMEWNTFLGFSQRLKQDGLVKDYLLLTIGCYFGLRASDILPLQWNQLLDKDEVIIIEKKTKKVRCIKINPKVQEALQWGKKELESGDKFISDGFIFATRFGGPPTISYVNKRLKKLCSRYNVRVAKASTHLMRKTFAQELWRKDGESERALVYLSDLFGHSSVSITRRYIGLQSEKFAEMYLSL